MDRVATMGRQRLASVVRNGPCEMLVFKANSTDGREKKKLHRASAGILGRIRTFVGRLRTPLASAGTPSCFASAKLCGMIVGRAPLFPPRGHPMRTLLTCVIALMF